MQDNGDRKQSSQHLKILKRYQQQLVIVRDGLMDGMTDAKITKNSQLKYLKDDGLRNQRKCLIIALAMAGTTTLETVS